MNTDMTNLVEVVKRLTIELPARTKEKALEKFSAVYLSYPSSKNLKGQAYYDSMLEKLSDAYTQAREIGGLQ